MKQTMGFFFLFFSFFGACLLLKTVALGEVLDQNKDLQEKKNKIKRRALS